MDDNGSQAPFNSRKVPAPGSNVSSRHPEKKNGCSWFCFMGMRVRVARLYAGGSGITVMYGVPDLSLFAEIYSPFAVWCRSFCAGLKKQACVRRSFLPAPCPGRSAVPTGKPLYSRGMYSL